MYGATLILENDPDIIEEYLSGNRERAANAFIRKYQSFVYSTVLRFLNDYDDADDVTQEVFIKALKNIANFRLGSSVKTWLYKISKNQCINFLRKRKLLSIFSSSGKESILDYKGNELTPQEELERLEFEQRFEEAMQHLPKKQRETFALRYFEDLPYSEISKMLGTSEGGLKANYFQAVKKLAKYLKEE